MKFYILKINFIGKTLACTNRIPFDTYKGGWEILTLPTSAADDNEVHLKVDTPLLRLTTVFNPFCVALVVDCDISRG